MAEISQPCAARARRRARVAAGEGHAEGELNIVPYLDVVINLMMFLLVTQSTLMSLGMISVDAPPVTPSPGRGSMDQLGLVVGVAEEGFFLASKSGVLDAPGAVSTGDGPRAPSIPRRANGDLDFAGLSRTLRAVKTRFPGVDSLSIAADANIPYQTIVKTLDASRSDAEGPLFPSVSFGEVGGGAP